MKLFLKEHKWFILLYLANFTLLLGLFNYLEDLQKNNNLLYFIFLSTLMLIGYLILHYQKSKDAYRLLSKTQSKNKETGASPLSDAVKSILEKQQHKYSKLAFKNKQEQENYLLFIDNWVHFIKTPLAVLNLITQDNPDSEMSDQVQTETDKILHAVNMALYYARSNKVSNDLHFITINVHQTVTEIIHELKKSFIRNEVFPKVNIDKDYTIQTDLKWFKFILYQLLINAIKYSDKAKSTVHISLNNNQLSIKDNGMGIPLKDQGRIFDQFFTGDNGRKKGESTGVGLYLVAVICEKLSYSIDVNSTETIGTEFIISLKNTTS